MLFSDKPGRTKTTTFTIDTGDASPIAQRPYQLVCSLTQPVEKGIKTLLEQGIITESTSEWSSPMAVHRKENNGKYEFTCLPFGTKTASGHFQKMVQKVLRGCEKYSESFIDDIVIYSDTFVDHLSHLDTVFTKLREAGLTAKPSKCKIGHAQVPYLGHLVGHGTVRPLQAKVETIQNFPRPETKKQVRGWLGLTGYYRKYVPNYSDIASSLTDLTKGKTKQWKIKWSDECENAFQTLKRALMSKPVLIVPDCIQQFIVQVDEWKKALGDDWIRWLKTVKDTNQKLMRWSLLLEEYDYEIEHKSGKMHSNADTLSRIE